MTQVSYQGTNDTNLSSEALKNIYDLVAQNIANAQKRCDSSCPMSPTRLVWRFDTNQQGMH